MNLSPTKKKIFIPLAAGFFITTIISLVLIRQEEYLLNRSVRETALRLLQISRLSRTTDTDYKMIFSKYRLEVYRYEKELKTWQRHLEIPYEKGVESDAPNWEFVFSEGRCTGYRSMKGARKVPKYTMVSFHHESSSRKKEIIFFKDGSWKVLG